MGLFYSLQPYNPYNLTTYKSLQPKKFPEHFEDIHEFPGLKWISTIRIPILVISIRNTWRELLGTCTLIILQRINLWVSIRNPLDKPLSWDATDPVF